ncbi:MAG: hypothetical protein QOE70_1517 [Chthoniobacter sp.]|jgi:hypothetical protein|nr:hypothetical protein [Chthoniobacter sp.]
MNEQPDQPEKPRIADPGEDMNVRHVHAAIWREEAEPGEAVRRMPLLLKNFYVIMFLWLLFYLINWAGGWKWDEYESSLLERLKRDDARRRSTPTEPVR